MRETALAIATLLLLAGWTPFPTAVSPEVPLETPPFVSSNTVNPILATNGTGALLLSVEPRVSRIGAPALDFYWAGPLDENAVPAGPSQPLGFMDGVSAASSGSGYLVTFLQDGDARAIRFSDSGTRLDGTPIALLDDADTISEVTWDGTAYVVVADDKAISIAEDGRILGTRDTLPLTGTVETASRNGVTLLVNHADQIGVNGPLYALAIGGPLQSLGSAASADVAAGDPGFLAVYERSGSIYARALDPSGAPAGAERLLAAGRAPHVVWSASRWLVLFETTSFKVNAIRFLDGPLAPPVELTGNGLNVAGAASGEKVFLAWDRHGLPEYEIQSATIEHDELAVNGVAGVVPASQSQPLLTTVDGATLVAWFDGTTRVRRMDGSSPARTIDDAGQPLAFAAGAHDALLVTSVDDAIVFTRVDGNGTALSTQRHPRNYPFGPAGAVWLGDRWLVVWRDTAYVASSSLARAIVNADGTLRDTPQRFGPILNATTDGVRVVATGAEAFVLWAIDGARTLTFRVDADGVARQGRNLDYGILHAASAGTDVLTTRFLHGTLEWQRVLPDGKVATRGTVPLPTTGMALETFFTGENYLVLLAKAESAPNRLDLYGFRVDLSGAPIDASPTRFTSVFTVLPPSFATATLRDATMIDLTYFRPLGDDESPRLVFRTVHDSPRRRVIR